MGERMGRPQHTARSTQRGCHHLRVWLCAVCCALSAGTGIGCGPPANQEQLRTEALKVDPSFSDVLQKRDEVANRILVLDRELTLKRSKVESQISQLRKELSDAEAQVHQKTEQFKTHLDPDRKRVELAYAMAAEELRAKRNQRASIGRSISRLRKALKQQQAPWTAEERDHHETELEDLLRETKRLDQEIAALNEHLRLLKIKQVLLRL